ncbi:MAG: PilZ domain-containing protein [Desulfobulbaceae bacterium]|nr:PilZ domain-containing protein [Desulfobulbaceae bacterium]
MNTERRFHDRILATSGTLVFNNMIFGDLIDISRSGLSFTYRGDKSLSMDDFLELDILCGCDAFFLRDIPCKTISDIRSLSEPASVITVRRRGVQFIRPSETQVAMLDHFCSTHAPKTKYSRRPHITFA